MSVSGHLPAGVLPEPAAQRESTTHHFKSWPDGFRAAVTGRKRFEVRRDDRFPPVRSGDVVTLHEFDPFDGNGNQTAEARGYTGRKAAFLVGWVQRGAPMPDGWCGFDLVSIEDANRAALALGRGK